MSPDASTASTARTGAPSHGGESTQGFPISESKTNGAGGKLHGGWVFILLGLLSLAASCSLVSALLGTEAAELATLALLLLLAVHLGLLGQVDLQQAVAGLSLLELIQVVVDQTEASRSSTTEDYRQIAHKSAPTTHRNPNAHGHTPSPGYPTRQKEKEEEEESEKEKEKEREKPMGVSA